MNAVMKSIAIVDGRSSGLDERLKAIDAIADRWSQSRYERGSLHPLAAIQLLHDGAVLGGGDDDIGDDVAAFDQAYSKAPVHEKAVIHVWYCTGGSAAQKAKRLGIGRTTLYLEWKVALQYMKGELRLRHINI